jgi:hypothetical protein
MNGETDNPMRRVEPSCLEILRGFADDAPFLVDKAFVDILRVDAPAGGEEVDFFGVTGAGFGRAEGEGFTGVGVAIAFHAEVGFGLGWVTLVPKRFARPGVTAEDAAGFELGPGVVVEDRVGDKVLDVAHLPAEVEEKAEAGVNVFAGIGQGGADDENPAVDGRGDKELLVAVAGNAFQPGTRLGVMQVEGGLDGQEVSVFDGQPTGWAMQERIPDARRRVGARGFRQTEFGLLMEGPGASPMNYGNHHENAYRENKPQQR